MPSTERRKQHRHADNHSHRRSWQRCRTSIHATRRSGLLVQCRRKPRLWRQEKHELVPRIPMGQAGREPATVFAQGREGRSEERRVGKECVSTCICGWSPKHKKKKVIKNEEVGY